MCNPLIIVHYILHENISTTRKAVMLMVQLEEKSHTYFLPKLFVVQHSLHYSIVFSFFWGGGGGGLLLICSLLIFMYIF